MQPAQKLKISKAQLRREFLAKRAILGQRYRNDATLLIEKRLEFVIHEKQKLNLQNKLIVACYSPFADELDLTNLYKKLQNHFVLAWPRLTEGDGLEFALSALDLLKPGKFGILQPDALEPVVIPDIIIVPALAFSKDGYRLGYGKGYYDRAIAQTRLKSCSVLTTGVCFSKLVVDSLPVEPHDQRVDIVISEADAG